MQSGGWTLSWQGTGNTNADFPGATSIWGGLKAAIEKAGGTATLGTDGKVMGGKPDVAVVVFGEQPYAEMRGDIHTLEFQPGDKQALALLKKLKSQGIPVVSVFLSGRPLWVNPEINQSDAFVAGWFPGSEGAGVADVLIGGQSDFRGTLSFNWPRNAGQFALHRGGDEFNPLFPLGYGLAYKHPGHVGQLDEAPGFDASQANTSIFFMRGKVPSPFGLTLAGAVTRSAVDSATMQEGALRLDWQGPGSATIAGPVLAFERETNADLNLQVTYRLEAPISGAVSLKLGGGAVGLAGVLKAGGWQVLKVPLKCFTAHGGTMGAVKVPFALEGDTGVHLSIADIRLASDPALAVCPQ